MGCGVSDGAINAMAILALLRTRAKVKRKQDLLEWIFVSEGVSWVGILYS